MKYRITYTLNGRVHGDVMNLDTLINCLKWLDSHEDWQLIAVTKA